MEFRISDTFTDSLGRLTGDEQKAVKTTAFDLQLNPANPGMQFHRIDRSKDANFWSVRVSRDIRLIVHKTEASLLLCYVDHHDRAYQWAERRKIERHPHTGAAQLVEVRETVKEITIPKYVEAEEPALPTSAPAPVPLFDAISREDLLRYGLPEEWLDDVKVATEDSLFDLVDHLPPEASEALLELATGGTPQLPGVVAADADPFEHPDAKRRFRVVANVEELERALDYPWEKWIVFLHPAQRELVEKDYNGPARVSGSAGTGKTIVALHRAVHLARTHDDARVLLATFSDTLANALRDRLNRLISGEPHLAERIDVYSMDALGRRLYETHGGSLAVATEAEIRNQLAASASEMAADGFSSRFLYAEWTNVVDAWQLGSWEEYRDVRRLGRKIRLPEKKRATLWEIFAHTRGALGEQGRITRPMALAQVAEKLAVAKNKPFQFAVVDEAQDIGVAELRLLAGMAGDLPNGLFFGSPDVLVEPRSRNPPRRGAPTPEFCALRAQQLVRSVACDGPAGARLLSGPPCLPPVEPEAVQGRVSAEQSELALDGFWGDWHPQEPELTI